MTSSHAFRRFAFAYGTAFAVLYVVALKLDLALFTVYASLGIVLLGTHHSRDTVDPAMGFLAPAMYWYGWTATASLGALVVGLLAALVPEQWTRRFWFGLLWLIPALAMIGCVYLTLPWFRLQPGLGQGPVGRSLRFGGSEFCPTLVGGRPPQPLTPNVAAREVTCAARNASDGLRKSSRVRRVNKGPIDDANNA